MIKNDQLSVLTIEALLHFRESATEGNSGVCCSREGVESVDFHPLVGEDFHQKLEKKILAGKQQQQKQVAQNDDDDDLLSANKKIADQQQQQQDCDTTEQLIDDDTLNAMNVGRMCTAGLDGIVRIWELGGTVERCIQRAYTERGAASHDHSFLKFVAALERTGTKDTNFSAYTCRFSPNGQLIASTYSDGLCIVWATDYSTKVKEDSANNNNNGGASGEGTEKWKEVVHFRGLEADIVSDVVDVAFTPDSSHVIFVGASGYTLIYQVHDQKASHATSARLHKYAKVKAHEPSTLGIAVDPFGLFIATTGSDKRIQFYDTTLLTQQTNALDWKMNKGGAQSAAKAASEPVKTGAKMFVEGAILGGNNGPFFRRSSWSPDGALAAFPYGDPRVFETKGAAAATTTTGEDAKTLANASDAAAGAIASGGAAAAAAAASSSSTEKKQQQQKLPGVLSSVILVMRANLSQPMCGLTLREASPVRGCRFAPKVFEPFPEDAADAERCARKGSWGPQMYRYALAVWTANTVVVYTSDCSARHSSFSNLHYAPINDAAWAPHCRLLAVASEDMTVSLVSFSNLLGETVPFRTLKASLDAKNMSTPLVTAAALLSEQLRAAAVANEDVVVKKVNKHVGGAVNKKVTVKKRRDREKKNDDDENQPPAEQQQPFNEAAASGCAAQQQQQMEDDLLKSLDNE